MAFTLPKYTDLTEHQRLIVNLPMEENHLITGSPGTGKSVIAIYRASDLVEEGKDVMLLVFNRPLKLYMESAVESLGLDAEVNTWHAWIRNFYPEEIGGNVPTNGGEFDYNWNQIKKDFKKVGVIYDQIILDEAQDLPKELIECLVMITQGITCFMDPRQTISTSNIDIDDVADILEVNNVYKLYDNYRNTKQIFDFAKLYNTEEVSDPVKENGSKPVMIKCTGYGNSGPKDMTSRIVQVLKRNFGLDSIGVFTNPGKQQYAMFKQLEENLSDTKVHMYQSKIGKYHTVDFDESGVFVITYNCMKGLEFDAVIIPRVEYIETTEDDDVDENIFYVACTRAKKKLFCFYFENENRRNCIDVFSAIRGNEKLLDWEN